MMVETMLESSQDFGMSNGSLPQWKRELLQRRAARSRPAAATAAPPAAPPPPPPPPVDEDDEELRYGPGIVKRLKSRYLSLALRDAPRRRPSVLRRAASLEHLLDEHPPPAPRPAARAARPASLAAPPSHALAAAPPPRRDSVKRARSVDALSRLDRDDHPPLPPKPQPQPRPQPPQQQHHPEPPPLPPSPPPPLNRCARPPRRPTPLLRETERPPPDVVRSALRKFESAPPRRPAPAARVSAVLRGLEALPRSSTPEPRGRSPSPAAADISAIDDHEGGDRSTEAKPVSRAALEGIARAGSTVRYAFEAPRPGSHLPPLAATNPVMLGRARLSASPRRVGVIRPMPSPALERNGSSPPPEDDAPEKPTDDAPRVATPPPTESESPPPARPERREPPPSALVEPIPRPAPEEATADSTQTESDSDASSGAVREVTPEPEPRPQVKQKPDTKREADPPATTKTKPLVNGHAEKPIESKVKSTVSRIGAAGIERAWTGAGDKRAVVEKEKDSGEVKSVVAPWARSPGAGGGGGAGAAARARAAPAATSVVFNFSNRKEVPDYIENDGIILRANRRNRFKAGEPGIVVLRPEALAPAADSGSEGEDDGDGRPPSPCGVRFVNDNVLINGKSSMPARPNRDRIAKLKLQFDDSLTRTFEYPSETSLCEESPATPTAHNALANNANNTDNASNNNNDNGADATGDDAGQQQQQQQQPALLAPLAANTHIVSASLSRYTPSKTFADAFELGVARAPPTHNNHTECAPSEAGGETEAAPAPCGAGGGGGGAGGEGEAGDARPCAASAARSWSESRTHATDLLF